MSDGVTDGSNAATTRVHGRDAGWKTVARSASSPATRALDGETARQSAGTTSRAGPTLTMRPAGDAGFAGLTASPALDPARAASAPAAAMARNAPKAVSDGDRALILTSRRSAHAAAPATAAVPAGRAPGRGGP